MTAVRRVGLVVGPSTGGIGMHVRSLAGELVGRGITVVVGAPGTTRATFDLEAGGARVVPDDRASLRELAAAVDVVHAHGLHAGAAALTALGRRGRRQVPLVVTWHNAVLARGLRGAAGRLLARRVARGADVTVVASADLVDTARRLGAGVVVFVPVAAPVPPAPVRSATDLREELGADDRPVVLAVGRIAPQKNYPMLLRAAGRWAALDPVPLVLVAGDGPPAAAAELSAVVARDGLPVRLLGRRADVAELMAAADVVVLTSWWEARALVAQEALLAGVPLVATAVGGVPELVGDAAVLVPSDDDAALAAAVRALLADRPRRERLAAAGRDRASTWPDEAAVTDRLLEVYGRAVAAPPARH